MPALFKDVLATQHYINKHSNMHIYLYLRHFPPNGENLNNGLCKAVHGLASGLASCGAKVTVLSEGSKTETSSYQAKAGYQIECFAHPIQHRPSFQISSALQHYIANQILPNSLVILNGILHPTIYSLSRLLREQKIPYVVAPHDVYHPVMFRKNAHLKFPYWYLLEKRVLQQAKAIQILDTSQEKWLKQRGVKTPIFVTPNGFSLIDVQSEAALTWRESGTLKIFFFGRMDSHHKGLDTLIDAFSEVIQVLDAQLILQGPKGDRESLEKQAGELLSNKKVLFLDPEYGRSASSVIADYDIFCLPSRFEGFGLSALEAMLAARVLLVSEEAGIATYVRDSGCGVVVAPQSSAIKSGLIELCQRRSEWQEMGLKGQRYVLQHLQWNQIASDALEQYQHLVN